ncbi:hypothetical protein K504DRAFT_459785 [Pleomassaria siparia CBS 279.74]|uniref:Uncharacterized protein n=1 Tax=Pleomassaria siparia CBS 279.74 TaxID=1314801 RepID=A0A6G1K1U1_9PLEO|nr:hypothetical protein K504DRAFT_459785 [Pleomassaria siparia CBS 279.74]
MSSDEDGSDLMAAFKKGSAKTTKTPSKAPAKAAKATTTRAAKEPSPRRKHASFLPEQSISDESSGDKPASRKQGSPPSVRKAIVVRAPPVRNRSEYTYYEPKDTVENIVREYSRKGLIRYEVKLTNGNTRQVTFDDLLLLDGGSAALHNFENDSTPSGDDQSSSGTAELTNMRLRGKPTKANNEGFVDIMDIDISSDDELVYSTRKSRQRKTQSKSKTDSGRSRTSSRRNDPIDLSSSEDSNHSGKKRRRRRKVPVEPTRRSSRSRKVVQDDEDDEEEDDDDSDDDSDDSSLDILRSDVLQGKRKRKRRRGQERKPEKWEIARSGVRQSDRSTRSQKNMQEAEMNDIYQTSTGSRQPNLPKVVSVREVFETLPRSNLFRSRHVEGCEVCSEGPTIAPLIYCQGCSLAYHKNCLGTRSTREHLSTKVGEENFVLQCRRCVNIPRKKDPTAPDLAKCQDCGKPGASCKPFRSRKTTAQEQKDREDNDGEDPVASVPPHLINNARNVLFRCTKCSRCYHYHHLPPLSTYSMDIVRDDEETADERFHEYSKNWLCKDCGDAQNKKVSTIIAWRPSDVETYRPGISCDMLNADDKQYLIKWEEQSYFQASWHSGAWTWGVTAPAMRKAFYKREDGPKMRTEDAIPEEYLRIDIVLEVKFTSYVEVRSEEIDKARIKEVDKALIKYKGLGYEDAVWEKVPTPEDGDRWLDFVTAYNDWVSGRYIKCPKQAPLKARLEKARGTPFAKLEKAKQPDNLVGGELMNYQMEGLNWLYYQWYKQKNCILADEMGLGKTIQVIGFMATLVQEHNCFPFLVVVPNSTCANWRREIKQWAPSLRVVTYFGSAQARNMAYKYEMYPDGTKELRCHVVVTSYDAAADDSCRRIFRGVNWAGLIVDEGQRLKNDKSLLYGALTAIKVPYRLLLTGTPMQNNTRELFNLLQFLDDTINAQELEEEYAEMTSENIGQLHDKIRPFILRRTKKQVLSFLPPLAQIIVPLSMSSLQKSLYRSILAKNPELLRALFTTSKALQKQERANLSNILMQLRKCLCHPFVYSREIEERTEEVSVSHRNLVEASAKLQFLELMLPKLKERGHRVLIFSQFLDMLDIVEDFLEGMQMAYQRLDGTIGSLEKQKRIDQFNAPESPLFAFLLSTRAGGVGINLATADTVIILDADFNPHQDIQAISRAHRIGQKKKVLCFQLMTRASAEEKIVQMGRKKMALDHVVVQELDAEDLEDKDVESMLKHGAAELFTDDGTADIRYDDVSIDKLLDRSQMENTKTSSDDSAESQFSFARVWANDQGALKDTLDTVEEEVAPDTGVWDKILKERQAVAAAEALARAHALGRGKRARGAVDYAAEQNAAAEAALGRESPLKVTKRRRTKNASSDSDTDFQTDNSGQEESAAEADADADMEMVGDLANLTANKGKPRNLYTQTGASASLPAPQSFKVLPSNTTKPSNSNGSSKNKYGFQDLKSRTFSRVQVPIRSTLEPTYGQTQAQLCAACKQHHPRGACHLKAAGVEHCGLCGLAHFGHARTCPHIKSETQVREMLQALKNSPEKRELVDMAAKYLRGVKGHLVQQKKKDQERSLLQASGVSRQPQAQMHSNGIGPGAIPQTHGPAAPHLAAPRRDVPVLHTGPSKAAPGSVGSYLLSGRGAPPQQSQRSQQASMPAADEPFDDKAVESALRGFLGH